MKSARLLPALVFLLVMGTQAMSTSLRIYTQENAGDDIRLRVGENIIVRLPVQAGTGYGWAVLPPSCCLIAKASRIAEPHPSLPGAMQVQDFQIQARAPGELDLHLEYRRPWEKNVAPLKQFRLHVGVSR